MGDVLTREPATNANRRSVPVVRARRAVALVIVCAGLMATLLACATVLGIEDRPLRVEGDAASPMDATADVGDGGADAQCNRFESRACSADCPRDFCDDFDEDGQAPETRWKTPIGFKNPFTRGDSGVTLTTAANSPPMALSATTASSSQTSYGMLAHLLSFHPAHDGQQFDGVRVAMDFRIDALSLTGTGGGPVKDAGNAAVLGMLRSELSAQPHGIAIVLSGKSMVIDVADDVLGGTGANALGVVNDNLDITFLEGNWLQLELFVGDRERAVKLGYDRCAAADVAPGLVAVAALGGRALGVACVDVPASFGPASWPEDPIILAGSLLFSAGNASFRIDNVVADFFVK